MSKITMRNNANLSFDEAFNQFIRKCQIKNLTDNSITSYRSKIKPFQEFLIENDIELSNIDSSVIDDFILWVRDSHNANDISINSYLRAVRAFCYFCQQNNWIISFRVSLPKATKKTKETYTEQELAVLLKKPNKNICSFTDFKIWAFENFLIGTGVRLSTALNIKIKDVDLVSDLIFLGTTKNRRQQYIPLARSLKKVIEEYLDVRGGSPEDYLFCNTRGGQGEKRTYQKMVADYNNDRGIERTSIHCFRHTYAKMFIINGGDAFRLQQLMGHSSIQVTKEYVDLFSNDLANGYDRFNPLDNLTSKGSQIRMK